MMTLQRKWTRKTSLKIVTGTKAVLVSVSVAILCLCLVIGHLLEENRWINESITATIIISGEEEAVLSELYNHLTDFIVKCSGEFGLQLGMACYHFPEPYARTWPARSR
ncbi:hypothetical protein V6N11_042602 [Hibiscus sabdariffa]|uniref:Uncharacterized protein n=1 Tax=Hibiscus sabdariffa TaxID=183260 RepID=A0ABR2QWZ1_9ROSI